MDITPFNAPMTKGRPKVIKTREGLDVAGRYFVYKLYETTDGQPMQWQLLGASHCSKPGAGYGTNFRSLKNHLWRDWLDREHRCVVPPVWALARARRQATLLLRRDLAAMGRRRRQQEGAQHRRPHAILDHDD
jgi:hypothetical protein